jgi:hypothetical protein
MMCAMERSEIDRRQEAVIADTGHLVGTTDFSLRVIDAGELLVIANVPDKSARPGVLQIIQRHFPGAAVKFEP